MVVSQLNRVKSNKDDHGLWLIITVPNETYKLASTIYKKVLHRVAQKKKHGTAHFQQYMATIAGIKV